jgi:hypothetical protein
MQTISANSLGNVACHLQVGVNRIQRVAERLRLKPVLTLDNVPHFSDEQVEILREQISRGKK